MLCQIKVITHKKLNVKKISSVLKILSDRKIKKFEIKIYLYS